jgi:hypothetical protein
MQSPWVLLGSCWRDAVQMRWTLHASPARREAYREQFSANRDATQDARQRNGTE